MGAGHSCSSKAEGKTSGKRKYDGAMKRVLGAGSGLICALAMLATPGCGDDDETAGERYANRYAEIYCKGAAPCCAAAGSNHDVDSCRDFFGMFLRYAARSAKHFDQAAADQCLVELEQALGSCQGDEPDVCDRVFGGDRGLGQACQSNVECALHADGEVSCLYSADGQSGGTCKLYLAPAEGQPCSSSSATEEYRCSSDPEFRCDYATDTCKLRTPIGQACSSSSECVTDATCDYTSGTCLARTAIGESCTADYDCVEAAYCSGQICTKRKSAGEACTSYAECDGYCDADTQKCRGSGFTMCVTSS
jgi:hypothetical protein